MTEPLPDIQDLRDQLDAVERDARLLVADLAEDRGCWCAAATSWSVAQCFDHLAITNRVYLGAMQEPATRARAASRLRRRPARPGLVGRWFAAKMGLPAESSMKMKSPRKVQPAAAPSLAHALAAFLASQHEVRDYLDTNADLDLAGIRFPNPFIPGIRFSLATGLHIIASHERRHMGQAWRARRAAEDADVPSPS